jgi:hypothetical protein
MNIRWSTNLALAHGRHLDLHLDYFLEESKQPFIFYLLGTLK